MVHALDGLELAVHLPFFRQSITWAMLLVAVAQAGGYDIRAYWDWYTCSYSTPDEIDEVRAYTKLPMEDTMDDGTMLIDLYQKISELEQIVYNDDEKRTALEAHLAALKQQAAYAANSAEYQAQVARYKVDCHQ